MSEPNYDAIKWFSENLVAIVMTKKEVKMNKPAYLSMAILNISKKLMYEFWYEYLKPKYGDKISYTDNGSFISFIKTEDFYKDIADNVEKRFDTSNYEIDRPFPRKK